MTRTTNKGSRNNQQVKQVLQGNQPIKQQVSQVDKSTNNKFTRCLLLLPLLLPLLLLPL
jgi:hypothetical protein